VSAVWVEAEEEDDSTPTPVLLKIRGSLGKSLHSRGNAVNLNDQHVVEQAMYSLEVHLFHHHTHSHIHHSTAEGDL